MYPSNTTKLGIYLVVGIHPQFGIHSQLVYIHPRISAGEGDGSNITNSGYAKHTTNKRRGRSIANFVFVASRNAANAGGSAPETLIDDVRIMDAVLG